MHTLAAKTHSHESQPTTVDNPTNLFSGSLLNILDATLYQQPIQYYLRGICKAASRITTWKPEPNHQADTSCLRV